MPDNLTPEQRRRTMAAVKGCDTSLELKVDRALRIKGWHCSRNVATLPGRPDFVFEHARVALFVDGDFWHGWQFPRWCSKLTPYWRQKIERNRRRDQKNFRRLRHQGWRVLRIWSHEVERDLEAVVRRVGRLLRVKSRIARKT